MTDPWCARPSVIPLGPALSADVWWLDVRRAVLRGSDLAELAPEELARAKAFGYDRDRHRYQAAHVMLRRVLADYAGARPAQLEFGRERCPRCGATGGRPALSGQPGLHFSLAHSGDAVVLAVAPVRVGIDLEQQTGECLCGLSAAMHPDDAAVAAALPEARRHAATLRWWVRTEAALKCTGEGIAHGLGRYRVLNQALAVPLRRRPSGPSEATVTWAAGCSVRSLQAPAGYDAAIATMAHRVRMQARES